MICLNSKETERLLKTSNTLTQIIDFYDGIRLQLPPEGKNLDKFIQDINWAKQYSSTITNNFRKIESSLEKNNSYNLLGSF